MNKQDKAKALKLDLEIKVGELLLKFYDETGIKIEDLKVILNQMPDGNVTGFYVIATPTLTGEQ